MTLFRILSNWQWLTVLCIYAAMLPLQNARAGTDLPLQTAFEARLANTALLSDILRFYNPKFESYNPGLRATYQQRLGQLEEWSRQYSDHSIRLGIESLKKPLAELEQLPKNRAQMRPVWVNRIVETHARLDELLARSQKSELTDVQKYSQQLALAVATQNLIYQTATFSSINLLVVNTSSDPLSLLDSRVQDALTVLKAALADSPTLEKLITRYQFIQPRLLGHQEKWVPSVVAFYTDSICELARELR